MAKAPKCVDSDRISCTVFGIQDNLALLLLIPFELFHDVVHAQPAELRLVIPHRRYGGRHIATDQHIVAAAQRNILRDANPRSVRHLYAPKATLSLTQKMASVSGKFRNIFAVALYPNSEALSVTMFS